MAIIMSSDLMELRRKVTRFVGKSFYSNDPKVLQRAKEGRWFLETTIKEPYRSCQNLGQLSQKLKEQREWWKNKVANFEAHLYGRQLTLLEERTVNSTCAEVREDLVQELEEAREMVKALHRCLGICSNPDYFRV